MGRITSELRLFAADPYTGWVPTDKQQANLRAIADRIDAEHEAACAEAYGNGVQSVALPDMAAYAKLPVDAEGEPIHVGDVMEWVDPDGEVTVTCTVDAVGVECFFAWDAANCRYAQKHANAYRHHHAPTVEDVLREFVDEFNRDDTELSDGEIIERFAAKLRLAGDE